jgi:hypothetical protein
MLSERRIKMDNRINRIRVLAQEHFVDVVAGRQSIEKWTDDVLRVRYKRGNIPKVIILSLEQTTKGQYKGELFITKEDFHEGGDDEPLDSSGSA